jgi:hypothetical protein
MKGYSGRWKWARVNGGALKANGAKWRLVRGFENCLIWFDPLGRSAPWRCEIGLNRCDWVRLRKWSFECNFLLVKYLCSVLQSATRVGLVRLNLDGFGSLRREIGGSELVTNWRSLVFGVVSISKPLFPSFITAWTVVVKGGKVKSGRATAVGQFEIV